MRTLQLLVLLLLFGMFAEAQDFSNKGKEFWLPYAGHIDNLASRMALYISATENTTGEVQLNNQIIPFTVTANQATTVQINPALYGVYNQQADGIGVKTGIRVVSQKPIVLYAHILNAARSGSTLVLPVTVLGKEYTSLNGFQTTNQGRSQITVVATEDNTTIELNLIRQSSGSPTRPANTPYQISLNKGDVYQVQSTQDLTGSTIKSIGTSSSSCKPIAVFTGSTWTAFDCAGASGGDNLYQQVFPSKAWGRNYITAPFANRQSDVYRIIVKDPTTQVTLNGTVLNPATLTNNTFYEFKNSTPNVISSDKPILVVQYMTSQTCDTRNPNNCGGSCPYPGDPEIVTINPLEQTINNVSVISARNNLTPPNTNISKHYLNILMKTADIGSLKIDNAAPTANWVPIPNSVYSYLQEDVTSSTNANPSHNIQADSGFIAIAYGMGNVESYGYNAGTNIIDLNPPVKVQNEFGDASVNFSATCVNSPFRVNLSLTYEPTQIVIDFLGTTNLSAGNNKITISPTRADSTYISNGKTYYYYKGPEVYRFNGAGTYPVKITTTTNVPQSDGCSSTNEQEITDNVVVNEAPVADVDISSTGCRTDAISFTDKSDGKGRPILRWLWDFSDGTTSTQQNPSKTFAASGNYTAKLTAITDYGCIGEITKNIALSDKATPAFSIPDTTCVGNSFTFKNLSTAPSGTTMNKWSWVLDTVATKINTTNEDVVQQFVRTGKYQIKLMVETSVGCKSDTLVKELNVRPYPQIGLVLPDFCLAEGAARFSDTSKIEDGTETDFKYEWKFNLNNTTPAPNILSSTSKNPNVTYFNVGVYRTQLKLVSKFGCIDSAAGDFTVNGSRPRADFVVLRSDSICSNVNAQIKHTSTVDFGSITKTELIWNLVDSAAFRVQDDNPATDKLYQKLYTNFQQPASKTFQVRLIAYSGNASVCRDSVVKVVTVNQSPKVGFSRMPGICLDAAPRQITQATEQGSVPGTFAYTGKGVNATGLFDPKVSDTGTYPIQFRYQTALGCADSATMPITVWPSPKAKFGVTAPLCEKNNILFSDSSKANYSKIVRWDWDFRDGDTRQRSDSISFNKRYDTAGLYRVILRVSTDSGCVSPNDTMPVRVTHLPLVNFTMPDGICLPDGRGVFTSTSIIPDGSEALFSYRWNFGDPNDPTPGLLAQMTHRYSTLGNKTVQLKVTSKDGCIDSLSKVYTNIYPQPKADFIGLPDSVCINSTAQLTDTSDGKTSPPERWVWNLANGQTSTLKNPIKNFTDSGRYNVTLHIFNAQGCVSDTISKSFEVFPYPVLNIGSRRRVVLEGDSIRINPTSFFARNPQFLWTPSTYLRNPTDSAPYSQPADNIRYYVQLTGTGGCAVKDSVDIRVLLTPKVPNAFSPNGDGVNDTWVIKYLEDYPNSKVDIYNRYGQLVYHSEGYVNGRGWDGTTNGKPLPIGTYYYVIQPGSGRKPISGSITIIR
ncbi:MAG: PKD domain-containing protein [Chitinophagaceae bacterium]